MPPKPTLVDDASDQPKAEAITWQQTKSRQTREAILQSAVDCFYEFGYANTSTENIAQRAKLSRGAMLHHFPTRFDLIKAAVRYLNNQRLATYAKVEEVAQAGAEYTRIEEGIDAYWEQLNSPSFIVFHELQVASRTDPELATVLKPALAEYTAAVREQSAAIFPDLALSEAFERANLLARYLMEGMAIDNSTRDDANDHETLLPWLKRELRRSFQDVLGSVKRKTS